MKTLYLKHLMTIFVIKVHKEAFQALMCLWDNKNIRENYSLSETVLNILCQILVGDSQLQKKLAEQQQQKQQSTASTLAAGTSTTSESIRAEITNTLRSIQNIRNRVSAMSGASVAAAQTPSVDQAPAASSTQRQLTPIDHDIIMQMIGMGFSPELAQEAVLRSPPDSLEQAVDYCFNHHTNSTTEQPSTSTLEQMPTTSGQTSASTISIQEPARPVIESLPNIEIALEPSTASAVQTAPPDEPVDVETVDVMPKEEAKPEDDQSEELCQLDKAILQKFAESMLPGLMKILDNVPDTVYRVCDLIVVVVQKYGEEWRDKCLSHILDETCSLIDQVGQAETNLDTFVDQKLASRLLLVCLLFEEMQLACAKIVNSLGLLDKLVTTLRKVTETRKETQTPAWLTALFILVDLIEKAALATKRKAAINEQFSGLQRVWKWYDERQNKWIPYQFANNKTIDLAYKNGETNVKIVAPRKHYVIHFNTMLQENEETMHKRPIMLSFEKVENNDMLPDNPQTSRPSTPLPTQIVQGLNRAQVSVVIESCVELIAWPVSDPDCLHAILRLILRLTRQHEHAVEFAARKGPQHILSLTQKNSFMGYASLITLIFRHICEDEKNLRLTMEKAIRLALSGSQVNIAGLQPGGVGTREFHNVLRLLGPAICRHPDLFTEVACDILRIIIRREEENSLVNSVAIAALEKPITQSLNSNQAYCLRTVAAKLMPTTPMPDYAQDLVVDLLNYLVKPAATDSSKKGKRNKKLIFFFLNCFQILSFGFK